MPRRDGTGPMGRGVMTGRGFGVCVGTNFVGLCPGLGLGLGYRRGFGRSFVADQNVHKVQKELLQEQKELFENRLAIISKQLESL